MRVVPSLMILLLCLSAAATAQETRMQPSQTGSQDREKIVTVKPKGARPQDSNCAPGGLSAYTGLSSSGGTWTATWTFTIYVDCGDPVLQSSVSWITPNLSSAACTPNPEPLNELITCTTTYTVAANTGATRSGSLYVSFGSSGEDGPPLLHNMALRRRLR